ncbi:dehydrogenase [Oscillospiraceae bacterium]|nr:dehydrogenase [Oscillospiraceae bacterium]BDF76778.1 dehydrogenase [Oscillospiraceae bacterium]
MLRIGVAGIGVIAGDYIALIEDGKVPGVELAAVCSRNGEHIKAVSERYGLQAAAFTDYGEMLSSGTVDAVLICTPHGQHPSMARQALEAGLHVLVEKPVGIFADEVEALLDVLRSRPGLVCGVLYNRRASRAYRYVHDFVRGGALGELVRATWIITDLYRTDAYYASGSWRGTWPSEGGGLLMTQASHQLDLMQWICGMPVSVLARCSTVGRSIQVENEAELFLTYPNGAHGHFLASAHECPGTNLLEICGTRGRVSIRDDSTVEVLQLEEDERTFARTCPSPFEKVPGAAQTLAFDDSDNKLQQAATIENFAQTVRGEAAIQCSLEEGLRSLQIIHGAYLSHWLEQTMPLPPSEDLFRSHLKRLTPQMATEKI